MHHKGRELKDKEKRDEEKFNKYQALSLSAGKLRNRLILNYEIVCY